MYKITRRWRQREYFVLVQPLPSLLSSASSWPLAPPTSIGLPYIVGEGVSFQLLLHATRETTFAPMCRIDRAPQCSSYSIAPKMITIEGDMPWLGEGSALRRLEVEGKSWPTETQLNSEIQWLACRLQRCRATPGGLQK